MNLDNRIKSLSDILTCFDTEKAKQFIGKQGYFTSCYSNFANINNLPKGRLIGIDESLVSEKYHANVDNANMRKEYYSFFIPECRLKPVEKIDDISILKYKIEKLEKNLLELKHELNNQKTIYNPFAPWTNCCASISYSDGFNPQANCCSNKDFE